MKILFSSLLALFLLASCHRINLPQIVIASDNPTAVESLAATEIRRYLYLRTGCLAEIKQGYMTKNDNNIIFLSLNDTLLTNPETYTLKTEGKRLTITGGSDLALLYGAYRFAHHLGVRFYLHGDVVPDKKMTCFSLPHIDETRSPLFATRGILPFHDFPEGPDWWTQGEYRAVLAQLPKMGMNFIGFHNYPEKNSGPEPLVWFGLPEEVEENGDVKAAYFAKHYYTTEYNSNFNYIAHKTGDYSFGASDFFTEDDYGPEYQTVRPWNWGDGIDYLPEYRSNKEKYDRQFVELFNASGDFFSRVFDYAHSLGIKVCVGTETPLYTPGMVRERLKEKGLNIDNPATILKLYEGALTWIKRNYSIDYYWLWTFEGWTWSGNSQKELDAVATDMKILQEAIRNVAPEITMATAGWVLGPQQDRALFDKILSKSTPFSCINQATGATPIDPEFASIADRPKWAIPWLEDDPAMTIPQLWAGRMRHDAADALAYGCNGLIGIHWRTQNIAVNAAALAEAAWEQSDWNPLLGRKMSRQEADSNFVRKKRDLDPADFYRDWAKTEFGATAAEQIAAIFTSIDGRLPRPETWINGPGNVIADRTDWETRSADYAFVDSLETLRPLIVGKGNSERFDYQLNQMRYLRSVGYLACLRGEYEKKLKEIRKIEENQEQKAKTETELIPLRVKMIDALRETHRLLFAFANTYGDLGAIANWQQHIIPFDFTATAEELENLLGDTLPTNARPDSTPVYSARIIVPELRTSIKHGEDFTLPVIILDPDARSPLAANLKYRPMGSGSFRTAPLKHIARSVYQVTIPAAAMVGDLEYYIEATATDGKQMKYPATAPEINQTVVVW